MSQESHNFTILWPIQLFVISLCYEGIKYSFIHICLKVAYLVIVTVPQAFPKTFSKKVSKNISNLFKKMLPRCQRAASEVWWQVREQFSPPPDKGNTAHGDHHHLFLCKGRSIKVCLDCLLFIQIILPHCQDVSSREALLGRCKGGEPEALSHYSGCFVLFSDLDFSPKNHLLWWE